MPMLDIRTDAPNIGISRARFVPMHIDRIRMIVMSSNLSAASVSILQSNIIERPIAALKPYTRNARTHSKKQLRQIAASIERFGFVNPVLVSEDDGIIAGHGRVEAAKLLGLKAVPTLALSSPIGIGQILI